MTKKQLTKLEDSTLWQSANKIADYVYELHDQLPAELKAETLYKLRGRALDLTAGIAEAEGSVSLGDIEYETGQARRVLFGIKNSYKYLVDQHHLELNPEFMIQLDSLIADIDARLQKVWEEIEKAKKESQK
jgi:hypothetical protein